MQATDREWVDKCLMPEQYTALVRDCNSLINSGKCSQWEKTFLETIKGRGASYLYTDKQLQLVKQIYTRVMQRIARGSRNL